MGGNTVLVIENLDDGTSYPYIDLFADVFVNDPFLLTYEYMYGIISLRVFKVSLKEVLL